MAKIEKTFTIGGTSVLDGLRTWRVANGSVSKRTSVLKFHGHTEIKLFELPQAMTRADAVRFLKGCLGAEASMPLSKRDVDAPTIGVAVVLEAGEEADYVPPAIEAPVVETVTETPVLTANEKRNARRRAARAAAKQAKASAEEAEEAAASTEGLSNGMLLEAVVEATTDVAYAVM